MARAQPFLAALRVRGLGWRRYVSAVDNSLLSSLQASFEWHLLVGKGLPDVCRALALGVLLHHAGQIPS